MSSDDISIRLRQYLELKGWTAKDFERNTGLGNGTCASIGNNTRKTTFDRISKSGIDLNVDWLITGNGQMLKNDDLIDKPIVEEHNANIDRFIVPLLPVEALANPFAESFNNAVYLRDCGKVLSPVANAELAIPVSGDSMEPEFQDGSIVYIKRINEAAFIPWGSPVILDTENGAFIKDVFPCEDDKSCIEARSKNPKYPPMIIPKASIYGMYRILNTTKFFVTR